jgi:hypothetical protein
MIKSKQNSKSQDKTETIVHQEVNVAYKTVPSQVSGRKVKPKYNRTHNLTDKEMQDELDRVNKIKNHI